MAKLSRMDKYKELRSSMDETREETATAVEQDVKLERKAAPEHSQIQKETTGVLTASQEGTSNPVMEGLLGEVTQYNLEKGGLVTDDTQMQILYDLSENKDISEKRSEHLETMESYEDVGGTTRNIYGSSLEQVSKPVLSEPAHVDPNGTAKKGGMLDLAADEAADNDELDVLTISSEETQEIPVQTTKSVRKKSSKPSRPAKEVKSKPVRKEKSKPVVREVEMEDVYEDDEEEGTSKAANIFMIVGSIVLIILIVVLIYFMKTLGIF